MPLTHRLATLALLVAAVMPAHAADSDKKCQLDLIATLPMSLSGPGLYPTIDGSINGKPTRVLADLGAFATHVEMSAIERMGIQTKNTYDKLYDAGGPARVYEARLKELRVGPVASSGVYPVLDLPDSGYGIGVGTDLLLRRDLEISIAQKYLKFFRPIDCGSNHLAYWNADAIALPFRVKEEGDIRPIFKVKLNGLEMEAMFSTSSGRSYVNSRISKAVGLNPKANGVISDGKATTLAQTSLDFYEVPVASLEIGDEMVRNVRLGMADLGPNSPADLVLGLDFLRTHRVLISSSQRVIYFSYLGGDIFTKLISSEDPWLKDELKAGNPDALYMVNEWDEFQSSLARRDNAKLAATYAKIAAMGSRRAMMGLGRVKFYAGDFAGSAEGFRMAYKEKATQNLNSLIYLSVARGGQAEMAKAELTAARAGRTEQNWDDNVADFYLGKIDAARFQQLADKDYTDQETPACKMGFHLAQSYLLSGDNTKAKPLLAAAASTCPPETFKRYAAAADLARLPKK
jgi:predicted aspartyl protease